MEFGESTLPRVYTVEVYSTVAKKWIEVGRERSAYIQPGDEDTAYFTYTFDPVNASRVRITITKDSILGLEYENYTCIGEIAVWGGPARAVSSNEGGSDNKETKPETETETETVAESESETTVREQETTAKDTPTAVAVVGCASSVGVGALAVLTVASAAVVIKRRKEE